MTRRVAAAAFLLLVACRDPGPGSSAEPIAGKLASGGWGGSGSGGGGGGPAGGTGGITGGAGGAMGGAGGMPATLDAGLDGDASVDAGLADAGTDSGGPEPQDLPRALRDLGVVALYPAPGASGRCPDPALRIVFSSPPGLGTLGKVQIVEAGAPVAALDMAVATTTATIDGIAFSTERAAYVEGNEAVFYPLPGPLQLGRSYTVHIEPGVLSNEAGSTVALNDAAWTFTTRAAEPADPTSITVASSGAGDFCQPQSALDFAASSGATIEIERGTYHGIIRFKDKARLTIRGADRKATILAGTNNETMNGGTAKRALVGIDDSRELVIERLTIHNRTPQGGSQAEALRMQDCDRCIVRDADIISLQDTLLWSGRIYARDCYIAGNVDFIWGTGTAYFDRCEIKTLGRKGYTVQARNGAAGFGYVFVDSRFTSDPGITGHWLARIDASEYPASHVAYLDCELGAHIDPAGWQVTGFGGGSLRFWEHGSTSPSGGPIDVSQRHPSSRQLSSTEAAQLRDPAAVLGGWDPR